MAGKQLSRATEQITSLSDTALLRIGSKWGMGCSQFGYMGKKVSCIGKRANLIILNFWSEFPKPGCHSVGISSISGSCLIDTDTECLNHRNLV